MAFWLQQVRCSMKRLGIARSERLISSLALGQWGVNVCVNIITLVQDVLAWYRSQAGGRGYQTLINATLREAMRGKQMTDSMREVLREVIREELHPH